MTIIPKLSNIELSALVALVHSETEIIKACNTQAEHRKESLPYTSMTKAMLRLEQELTTRGVL